MLLVDIISKSNVMSSHEEKQVGSNLTGAAIPAKPGHQRDIPVDQYPDPIENTDALLSDVNPDEGQKTDEEV